MSFELLSALVLFSLIGFVVVAYGVRVTLKGQAHYDRVNRQGGSFLLSKSVMEVGYWFFQPLARFLVFCHVTANQISWASLAFGFLAACCLAFGHFGTGAVFAAVSAMMDSLDGLVARFTGSSSEAGEVLDASIDRYVEFFFLGGLVIYYREIPVLLVLALVALMGSFMVSYSTAKAEALHIDPPKGNMRRPERALYLTLGAALSPVTISFFENGERPYSIAIGHPMVMALCLVAVMANFSAIERLWAVARAIRIREAKGPTDSGSLFPKESDSCGDGDESRNHASQFTGNR
ncbi:MAG: CDP-alcohol phosphatidyltransferase family protein [Bdellovibrionia bacterium]